MWELYEMDDKNLFRTLQRNQDEKERTPYKNEDLFGWIMFKSQLILPKKTLDLYSLLSNFVRGNIP